MGHQVILYTEITLDVIKKFNNQKLDLIQLSFNLTKTELNDSLIKVQNQIKSLKQKTVFV